MVTLIKMDHEADVERCQGINYNNQCPFKKSPGSDYCEHCAGVFGKQAIENNAKRNYKLTKWRSRVNEFADSTGIKSLREEIGITRLLLEEVLNQCHDTFQLMIHTTKITELVTRIQKLVESCHRLEEKSGLLIDKSVILQLSGNIIQVISNHVKDSDTIDTISEQIMRMIVANPDEVKETSQLIVNGVKTNDNWKDNL